MMLEQKFCEIKDEGRRVMLMLQSGNKVGLQPEGLWLIL